MTPERWAQVRTVFESALEHTADDRGVFLKSACAGDEGLLSEVRELLASFDESPDFMSNPVTGVAGMRRAAAESDALEGSCIGPWKLLRRIGSGGMAAVYAAARIDHQFQKIVAIKVVKPGMDTEEILRRFRHERQVLASLEHPHIARLLDGGTTDYGLPYLIMEYVEGIPIDQYCDSHKLSTSERLTLFRHVCSAVHYAHQNLVVHRDLKPANILVTSEGVPKLLDFGIAKLLRPEYSGQSVHLTRSSLRPMTPEYASPEQVRGDQITTASDVYSLGVVLYKLLTGEHPYRLKNHTPTEIEKAIREWEPELPSATLAAPSTAESEGGKDRLKRRLRGDLDVIVMTALRKEPQRRYPSVERLSEDIALHLGGAPVSARKDTWRYRTAKFLARHKAGAAIAVLILVSLLASTAVSLYFARQAQKQKRMAMQLASFMVGDFDNAMKSGITTARKAAQEKVLAAIHELSPNADGDGELRKLLIKAYLKIGDLQGNVYENNLGDAQAAQQSYQTALELAESGGLDFEVAQSKLKLADLAGEAGDRAAALEQYRKSKDILESMQRQNPGSADVLKALTRVWYKIGFTQYMLGHPQEALNSYRRELHLAGLWSSLPGAESDSRRELAVADEHVGDMLAKSGNPEEGLRNLRRSLATYDDLSKAAPSNMTYRSDTAAAHLLLGEALLASGKQADAVIDYRTARQLYASLVKDDPQNEQYQVDLHLALERLSSALQKSGQLAEARQVTVDLLAGLRLRVERDAPSPDDILQYCWVLLTTPFKDLANPQMALRLAQKAVDLTQGADPGKLNVLALAWEANGDLSKAIETEQRALKATQAGTKRDEIEGNLVRFKRLKSGLR